MRFPTFCVVAGLIATVAPAQAIEADREGVYEIQILLQHLGYEPGQIDGLPGPQLAHAIRVFEAEHGLPVTGRADTALNDLLHDLVAASPSRAFLATTAPPPSRGFWQRHAWPSRMGGY